MSSRLADRLSMERQRRFVGRERELHAFQAALTAPELPFYVLYIFGPGGIGKTSLLTEFASLATRHLVPVYSIDSRNVEATPEAFVGLLQQVMGLTPPDTPLQVLAARAQRQVILIDTAELLAPLEGWLRDTFLPQLPADLLVVLAGRESPSLAWRSDPGWQAVMSVLPLRNLSPNESENYLALRQVPADQHSSVLNFTHGHPLALSLVADVFAQRADVRFHPTAAPDIIKTLLEQFVQKVPSPAHRAALEACALVRLTTEALLAEMLNFADVHELFTWLRSLSFIESGRQGIFPHDLAREAIDADLRWRNPDWYAELHRRARTSYSKRLQAASSQEQQRVLADYIFLHRNNPVVRPFFEWQSSGNLLTERMQERDTAALLALVTRFEGEASAQIAAVWHTHPATSTLVIRDPDGQPAGFLVMVALEQLEREDQPDDPAVQAAWNYLQAHAPLRPGECATLFRFWMARDTYQSVSPIQSLIFINIVRYYLVTAGLAFTFFPCADPEFWFPMLSYANLARLPAADFAVGTQRYGMYGHDWRIEPPTAWLSLLAEREIATETAEVVTAPAVPAITVLSETEFVTAIRHALLAFTRPDRLRANPLVRSRLVMEHTGAAATDAERVTALQTLLKSACEALQASPRDVKLYRALYHTYLQPAPTQEQAAELLSLPFSTFRRHLKRGITRVTELLWQWELQGRE